jgi:membrane protein implicated in regulation of membrane protease activity
MFLVAGIVLFIVLPYPWDVVALAVCLVLFIVELVFWWRRVRGLPKGVGAENLIGAEATVISPCRPRGEVSVGGERWQADCAAGADQDEVVTVVGRKRLVLIVEAAAPDR